MAARTGPLCRWSDHLRPCPPHPPPHPRCWSSLGHLPGPHPLQDMEAPQGKALSWSPSRHGASGSIRGSGATGQFSSMLTPSEKARKVGSWGERALARSRCSHGWEGTGWAAVPRGRCAAWAAGATERGLLVAPGLTGTLRLNSRDRGPGPHGPRRALADRQSHLGTSSGGCPGPQQQAPPHSGHPPAWGQGSLVSGTAGALSPPHPPSGADPRTQ